MSLAKEKKYQFHIITTFRLYVAQTILYIMQVFIGQAPPMTQGFFMNLL